MKGFQSILGFALAALLIFSGVKASEIRHPAVAGQFYPADSAGLSAMVKSHLDAIRTLPQINGEIIAIIVPHAGLIYSGGIAAHAYKLLENKSINRVILCGASHRYRFSGLSVFGPEVIWKTPLGNVPCDAELCERLLESFSEIDLIPEAHLQEHSLEVQLPYLQTVLPDFQMVPIIMGFPDTKNIKLLERALLSVPDDGKTVLIASTDWQHYRPASEGWKLDSLGIECIRNLDADALEKNLQEEKVEMCGGAVAVAVIRAAVKKGANKAEILKYGNSGDITGDKSSVVGYLAAAIYRSNDKTPREYGIPETKPKPVLSPDTSHLTDENDSDLSPSDSKELLRIARESVETYLKTGTITDFSVNQSLQKLGAAFVTLTENGRLRGCIGQTAAVEPLYKTVAYCAIQAAVGDPRFSPVKLEELEQLHIEISVLSPLQEVKSIEEILVGRDGLMISRGNNRGLLLPQVATDYKWNRSEFLEQTCRKAGLPPDAYRSPDAVIYKFQASVFGE